MTARIFSVIGCEHEHISIFIAEMLALGYKCKGIYEPHHTELATKIADRYRIPLASTKESLLTEEVSIVGSAAINDEKIDVIELCEQYEKPIMLDKPAVTNRAGLARLRAVLERGRIHIGMLLTERFRPTVQMVKQAIDEGKYGEIVHISIRKPHMLKPQSRPSWHFSKKQSGGIMVDLLIHDVDLLRFFTGQEIVSWQGFMGKRILPEYPDFYDVAGMQVLLAGGITAQLYADWHTPESCWTYGDGRIFIVGTRGTAELRLAGDPLGSMETGEEAMFEMTDDTAWTRLNNEAVPVTISEDFVQRIHGKPSWITHEDIYTASEVVIAADESAEIITSTNVAGVGDVQAKGNS